MKRRKNPARQRLRPLECGDLSPLSVAAEPLLFLSLANSVQRLKESGSAANKSGDKSPHSKTYRTCRRTDFRSLQDSGSLGGQSFGRHKSATGSGNAYALAFFAFFASRFSLRLNVGFF